MTGRWHEPCGVAELVVLQTKKSALEQMLETLPDSTLRPTQRAAARQLVEGGHAQSAGGGVYAPPWGL